MAIPLWLALLKLLAILQLHETVLGYSDVETRLINQLLQNGTSVGRPVMSSNDAVKVSFDLKLHKIEQLLTKEQHLIAHTFVVMRWTDPRFTWNPSQWNGTRLVNLANTAVWTPDIILYNSADTSNSGTADFYKSPVHLHYNGTVVWFSTVAWQSSCAVDITWFPVDRQKCDLIFGSLTHSKSRLKLSFHSVPTGISQLLSRHHVTNGEWDIIDFTGRLHEQQYECCEAPVSQVIYTVTVKRRPLYFFLYLIFPVIAIVLLSLLIFKIPPETGERIGFAVTILLTMGVYLMVISQDLPRKSDNAPMVGVLYVTLFYVMVLGTTTGVITAAVSFRITSPPQWLRKLVLKFSRKNSTKVGAIRNSFRAEPIKEETSYDIEPKDNNMEVHLSNISDKKDQNLTLQSNESIGPRPRMTERQKSSLFMSMRRPLQEYTEKDIDNQQQWQEIAYFLDTAFFWAYFVAIVVSSCAVLLGLELKYAS